jgi:hypothetical protein
MYTPDYDYSAVETSYENNDKYLVLQVIEPYIKVESFRT